MPSPLTRVLDWLRAGYPEGVPSSEVVPLLALLTRTLRPEEVEQIAATVIRENPDGKIAPEDVRATIERMKDDTVTAADVNRVAARLAAVGWPLSDTPDPAAGHADSAVTPLADPATVPQDAPAPTAAATSVEHDGSSAADGAPAHPAPVDDARTEHLAQRILAWLTAGYPEGIPPTDRVPLMALLRRRLTDDEVTEIADRLVDSAHGDGIDRADAGSLITRYTDDLPSDADMARVASELAAKGWPLHTQR